MGTTQSKGNEKKEGFTPISSLSWDEASELLCFPKPNTDGFYEQMEERGKKIKEQEAQSSTPVVQTR